VIRRACALVLLVPLLGGCQDREARAQNAWMGFEEELLTKYGHYCISVSMLPSSR
jgi:hypothetical protein